MPRKKKPAAPRRSTNELSEGADRAYIRWWAYDEDSIATAVEGRARMLWDDDAGRRAEIEKNLRRWGITLAGLYLDHTTFNKDAMRVNLTKSLTETITANVGKQRPRPLVLTDNGKFANRTRAKKLQRFLDGAYQQTDVYISSPGLFRNAMLCGTGAWYVDGDAWRSRFELENIFPLELLVDNAAATRGERYTREIFRVYPADKDTLIERYEDEVPDVCDAIERAPLYGIDQMFPTRHLLDGNVRDLRTCMVVEAWRKAGYNHRGELIPGLRIKVCNGVVLEQEEWVEDAFPFVFHHWNDPVRGFWGESAVAEIRGLEREANVNLQRGQNAMRLGGMPIIVSPETAELKPAKVDNGPFPILPYRGQIAPTVQVMPAAHPDLLRAPERLITLAQNQLGTNNLQTAAERPPGTESGRMLEQLSETQVARMETVGKRFEHVVSKELAIRFVAAAKRMDRRRKDAGESGFRLRSTYKREVIDLRWDEVELGPDEFFIDVWPVSGLPHSPSGRTAEIERWQNNGWLTPDRAKRLLDFPDLESDASVSRASQDLLEWQLGQMLDDGEQVMPERRQNLQEAYDFGTHAKLKALRENVPAKHIALLEDFLLIIEEWLNEANAPTAAPGDISMPVPGAEGDPSAAGMPMPVSPDSGALMGMGATPALASPQIDPAILGAGPVM